MPRERSAPFLLFILILLFFYIYIYWERNYFSTRRIQRNGYWSYLWDVRRRLRSGFGIYIRCNRIRGFDSPSFMCSFVGTRHRKVLSSFSHLYFRIWIILRFHPMWNLIEFWFIFLSVFIRLTRIMAFLLGYERKLILRQTKEHMWEYAILRVNEVIRAKCTAENIYKLGISRSSNRVRNFVCK